MTNAKIIFISGPSGVGKGTLIKRLKERHAEWVFPISCTTRPPRKYEKNGENYFFISPEEFDKKIQNKEFFEYIKHKNGFSYGSLKSEFKAAFESGKTIIRELDSKGLQHAQEKISPENLISVFISPANGIKQLVEQMQQYPDFSKKELDERLEEMGAEFRQAHHYDEQIVCEPNKKEALVKAFEDRIAHYFK